MYKSIALVFPESTFLEDPMVFPPLGLWYLGAQLEALGHRCEFFALDQDKLPADGDFDQMWLSATSPQMHAVRGISDLVADWTKTRTVFGGAASWAHPTLVDELKFNVTVAGEADHPQSVKHILELLNTDSRARLFQPAITPGPLTWVLPPIRRWDHKYSAFLTDRNGELHRTTTTFTSRGCPMACAFCESGRNGVIWDRLVRYEPLPMVYQQLDTIMDHEHSGVMFYDDILPLQKDRTIALFSELKRRNLVVRCFLRTDVITKQGGYEYLAHLADCGLVEVLAGVESADNRIKNNIHKGTTIEQDTEVLGWCKQLGIRFKASFILGLPGEDWASMNATRDWILKYRPDRVDVNTLIPFPGTPISREHDVDGKKYDLYWTEKLPEEYFYKGHRTSSNGIVGTSALLPHEIKEFRDKLVQEIIEAGIPY